MLVSCGDQWHKINLHILCDVWYFIEMYRNAYSIQFHHVPDKKYWLSFEGPTVLPPPVRKKMGCPKSTRIRNLMDVRERTDTSKRKCSNYNELGHYKKKCPQILKSSNLMHQTRGNLQLCHYYIFFKILIFHLIIFLTKSYDIQVSLVEVSHDDKKKEIMYV
jgi:hypothetical protein